MDSRAAPVALVLASTLLLVLLTVSGPAAEVAAAVLVAAFPVILIVLGRRGRLGGLRLVLVSLLLLFAGSLLAMLALAGRVAELPWIGGLPLAAAILVYGLWLVPLVIVVVAYALSFDRHELCGEDLERLRALRGRGADDGEHV